MKNLFYFSDYIKPLRQNLRFIVLVLLRFLRIIFRRNRKLSLLQFGYEQKHQFKKSFFFIRYQFENVLWYSFEHIKRTTEAGVLILNVENQSPPPLKLIVHGLCQKKIFLIYLVPEVQLHTRLFYPDLRRPFLLQPCIRPVSLSPNKLMPAIPKIHVRFPAVMVRRSLPHFSYSSFNLTDSI